MPVIRGGTVESAPPLPSIFRWSIADNPATLSLYTAKTTIRAGHDRWQVNRQKVFTCSCSQESRACKISARHSH